MAVVQQNFYIPPEIQRMVAKGQYKVWGGVVRWAVGPNKGKIVQHLKPVELVKNDAAKNAAAEAVKLVKNNRIGAIAVGVGAAAVVGAEVYKEIEKKKRRKHHSKKRQSKKKYEPEVVTQFKRTLAKYMDAISSGSMTVELIDEMNSALEALSNNKDVKIELSFKEIDQVINLISSYTEQLVRDNPIEIEDDEKAAKGDNLITFRRDLKIQKKVFEEAA